MSGFSISISGGNASGGGGASVDALALPEPLTVQYTASGIGRNGAYASTSGVIVSAPTTLDGSLPQSPYGDDTNWCIGLPATTAAMDLLRNSYVSSATLSLDIVTCGASFAGAKVYGKKVDQATAQVAPSDGIDAWISAGKLTTQYTQLNTANCLAGQTCVFDITAIIREMVLSPEWDETDHPITLVVVPDGTNPTFNPAFDMSWARHNGTSWRQFITVSAVQNAASYETAPLIDSTYKVLYAPVSATDVTRADSHDRWRVVVGDSLGAYYESIMEGTLAAGSGGTTTINTFGPSGGAPDYAIGTTTAIVEQPVDRWPGDDPWLLMFGEYQPVTGWGGPSGHQGDFTSRSYLIGVVMGWNTGDQFDNLMDTYGGVPGNWEHSLSVGAGASITVTLRTGDPGVGEYVYSYSGLPAAGAGRTLGLFQMWDHNLRLWGTHAIVHDAAGAVLFDETHYSSAGVVRTAQLPKFLGFRWGISAMYGYVMLEFPGKSILASWESLADHMTGLWRNGIKSIDPRLMQ
jgi:hypothetical protein